MFKDLPEGTTQFDPLAELKEQSDESFRKWNITIKGLDGDKLFKRFLHEQISIAYEAGTRNS